MSNIQCSCGSTNCTLLSWNARKEGAKTGGLGGAFVGALIGLAGGPIGAIAGAAIGAAGGAIVGEKQPTDHSGRKIETYKCNSCNKKFEICPRCGEILLYDVEKSSSRAGTETRSYCKNCHNYISYSLEKARTQAQMQASREAGKAYGELVKNNIRNLTDD